MTKIALTAAAILVATGTAFAGSDNFDRDNANQSAVAVDQSTTASISKSTVAAQAQPQAPQGADRNLFGR
ncbi:hypothetical protein GCM10007881_17520 [Mesorhizobium huakuii]|uniref:DUF680 domain-containing protein n=1 Tax=Mesorhizobium huakuii TaxID=28104 RepID=A0ABZ0VNQ6_9HYPH|nr:DUF680 domain-containing protein [Mesorhizobium huakuii]WQB98306.1 DUF680 domain-containing protein [Mesorhizobium huakuii]GLQ78236.1 hypothetical protein GCM10007881_17520 [Mesorhizobium huakuii]